MQATAAWVRSDLTLRVQLDCVEDERVVRAPIVSSLGELAREAKVRSQAIDRLVDEDVRPVARLEIRTNRLAQDSQLSAEQTFWKPLGSSEQAVCTGGARDTTPSFLRVVACRVYQRGHQRTELTGDVVEPHAVPWVVRGEPDEPRPNDCVDTDRERLVPQRPLVGLVVRIH